MKEKINQQPIQLNLRAKSSDLAVYTQIFSEVEYQIAVKYLQQLAPQHAIKIIDAGGNIGLTTVFLKAHFPDAHCVVIEPNASNAARVVAHVNDNNLTQVRVIEKGLYSKVTTLVPDWSFRDGEHWAFSLKESNESNAEGIATTTLQKILAEEKWEGVDLLKIDIEGSEVALLRDKAFIEIISTKVKLLAIEIHSEFISNEETGLILNKAGFLCFPSGELTIGLNKHYYQNLEYAN